MPPAAGTAQHDRIEDRVHCGWHPVEIRIGREPCLPAADSGRSDGHRARAAGGRAVGVPLAAGGSGTGAGFRAGGIGVVPPQLEGEDSGRTPYRVAATTGDSATLSAPPNPAITAMNCSPSISWR